MDIAERLNELAKIQRPFSHPFRATEFDTYLIDDTFAFQRIASSYGGIHVLFVADIQLPIIRENAKKNKEPQGIGISKLVLAFTFSQRVVYLGNKYKFSLSDDQRYFQLQSANSINFEPVSLNIDLKRLVTQRTLPTNT